MRLNHASVAHTGALPRRREPPHEAARRRLAQRTRVSDRAPQAGAATHAFTGRLAQLDGLRGLAALAVLFFHYFGIYPDVFEKGVAPVPHAVWGKYGVQLFFVVSGFVILMTLSRVKRPSDFLIGRFVRLYPTYWAAVLLTAAVIASGVLPDTGVTQHSLGIAQLLANLTMFQSYLSYTDLDGVYWTLAYELSFYAWAFLLLTSRQVNNVERLAAAYLLLQAALFAALESELLHIGVRLRTLLIVDYGHFFVVGMMFYRLRSEGSSRLRHALIAWACLAQAARGELEPAVVLAAVVLVFYALHVGRLRWLGSPPLAFLGSISYALYAVHEMPGWALMRVLRGHGVAYWQAWAITVPSAILLAWLITRFVERPLMPRLKALLVAMHRRLVDKLRRGRAAPELEHPTM